MDAPARPPERIGPYTILRRLGSGAMGTVYAAHDGENHVALKVIHPHLIERKGYFQRFRREALAGARVDHPNVLRTLDFDLYLVGATPLFFLVMEYVEGKNLRQILAEGGRLSDGAIRKLAAQIAAGLAAIHEKEIVHRDLKPENVLVTADQQVRILDLGVARLADAVTPISDESHFAGSLLYASPEQIRGEPISGATDLYALGVMLYELATGRNPFRRPEPAATMQAHLDVIPAPVRLRNPHISPFVEEVISSLLEKEPAKRIHSAAFLGTLLTEGEDSAWWVAREARALVPGVRRPRLRVERPTALYGRDEELSFLHDAWGAARGGETVVLLITGEEGLGRSRLVDDFLGEVAGAGVRTVIGVADAGADLRAARGDDSPFLFVVDDVDRLSEGEQDRLVSSLERLEGRRLLAILVAPPGPLSGVLRRVPAVPGYRSLELDRLPDEEMARILRELVGGGSSQREIARALLPRAEGVPWVLIETAAELVRRGQLVEGEDGEWRLVDPAAVPVPPESVLARFRTRLQPLSRGERALLDAACVLGATFDAGAAARIRRISRVEALEHLAAIGRLPGIVRAEGAAHRFDHNLVRDCLYAALDPGLRREYHLLAARAIAEEAGGAAGTVPPVIAASLFRHLLASSKPRGALRWFDAAIRHHQRTGAHEALSRLFTDLLAMPGLLAPVEKVDVLVRQAAFLAEVGRVPAARDALESAIGVAREIGEHGREAKARCRLALLVAAAEPELAEELLAHGEELAWKSDTAAIQAVVRRCRGEIALGEGRLDDAAGHYGEALRLARTLLDGEGETTARINLGLVERRRGRPDAARRHFAAALARAEETENPDLRRDALLALAALDRSRGAGDAAAERCDLARRLARETGDVAGEIAASIDMGRALLAAGRFDAARGPMEDALALARKHQLGEASRRAAEGLGRAFHGAGHFARAIRAFEQALHLALRQRHLRPAVRVLLRLAEIRARLGDAEDARRHLGQAAGILGRHPWPDLRAQVLLATMETEELAGDPEGALLLHQELAAHLAEHRDPVIDLAGRVAAARALTELKREEEARQMLAGTDRPAAEAAAPWHVLARCLLARLGSIPKEEAGELLAAEEERLPIWIRMEAHHFLSALGAEHAEEAFRLFFLLRSRAPEEWQVEMIRSVPLARRITELGTLRGDE